MTAAGVFSLLPLFLSFPVSTHKKAGKLRFLQLPNEEITTLCSFSKRSCPFKYQSWKLSIYPFIIFTKDLCQFRTAKLCEISVIRTGNNVHPVSSFLLWKKHILKTIVSAEYLLRQRIPCSHEQATHTRHFHQLPEFLRNFSAALDGGILDHFVCLLLAELILQCQIYRRCRKYSVSRVHLQSLWQGTVPLQDSV